VEPKRGVTVGFDFLGDLGLFDVPMTHLIRQIGHDYVAAAPP